MRFEINYNDNSCLNLMPNLKFRFPVLYYQVKVSSYQLNGGNRYFVSVLIVVVLKRVEKMQECKFKNCNLKIVLVILLI